MNLEVIDDLLTARNLNNPQLDILRLDANLYDTLLLQPEGEIEVNDQYIGDGSEEYEEKVKNFINLAKSENVKLAITPEYSCPWSQIERIISEDIFPAESSLWIIGCQSITKDDFLGIIENPTVEVIVEDDVLESAGSFLNPVLYFFKTRDTNDALKNVVIVQFKTAASSDPDLVERDNMIRGNKIYVLRNNLGSIHLLTYICSDALEFDEADFNQETPYMHSPFLIIHIQLNTKPSHVEIQRHRQAFFRHGSYNKEIICLNWARSTKVNSKSIDFGGSALYTKAEQLDYTDQRISSNHKNGLYYTFWGKRHTHAYYFNSDEAVYYFRNTKVSQLDAAAPTMSRTGPEISVAYYWSTFDNQWKPNEPNDGLSDLCLKYGYNLPILTSDTLNPIDKERIVALSCGRIKKRRSQDWYAIKELESFIVSDDEVIKRITFVQDPHPDAERERNDSLEKFSRLTNAILSNHANFPKCISDLFNNSRIGYIFQNGECDYDYNLNPVTHNESSASATVAFIGIAQQARSQKIYVDISALIGGDKSRRLVIWYLDDDNITRYVCDPNTPKVADAFSPGNSIMKEN